MQSELSQAIKQLVQERGIPEDLVMSTIENFLLAAYKKKYGVVDNAVVRFSDDQMEVTLFAKKKIVLDDDLDDPVYEMPLSEALELNEECEVGDELLIEINPKEFDRVSVQSAKQKARQSLREIQKDTLYSEFKDKVGEMIIGYYQRERNGNIYVDLGKTEGILPKKYQSPREIYHPNDRIKALIYEVVKTPTGLQIVLSRNHAEFVKKIFELEVPEIYDKTIEISKIVREPGYRTKIAVRSTREDVDPVGACVGLKGVRIQAVVRELEGEKIDILRYSLDARSFIKNALSPAEVNQVVILDESKKLALAIVPDAQFSLAIGKQGLNVRLGQQADGLEHRREDRDPVRGDGHLRGGQARRLRPLRRDGGGDPEDLRAPGHPPETRRDPRARQDHRHREPRGPHPGAAGIPGRHHGGGYSDHSQDHRGKRRDRGGRAAPAEEAEEAIEAAPEEAVAEEGAVEEPAEAAAETAEAEAAAETEEPAQAEAVEEPAPAAQAAAAPPGVVEETVEEETYECPECGTAITPDMATCPNCGVGLTFEDSAEDAPAGPPGAKGSPEGE